MKLITIKVTRELDDDGQDIVGVKWQPEDAALVDLLGVLRMAEDTVMRVKMGEVPE